MNKILTVQEIQHVIATRIPDDLVVAEHTSDGHFYRHVLTNNLLPSVTTKGGILENPHLKQWVARLTVEYIDKNFDILTRENKDNIFKAARMAHVQEFEEAGDIGTQGHGIVEEYLNEWMNTLIRPMDIKSFIKGEDSRLWAIARSAEMFCKDFNVVPVVSEKFVCSLKHRFAGTLDSLMMVQRVLHRPLKRCLPQDHNYMNTSAHPYKFECFKCGQKVVLELALVDWKTSNNIDKPEYAMQVSAYWQALAEMTGLRPKHIFIVRLDKDRAKYEVLRVVDRPGAFKAFLAASKIYDWLNNGREKLAPTIIKERILLNPNV